MRTLLTVCSTLACAGSAFVAYEHPEWIRQTAQHWEAWRKSSAAAPPATPVAQVIDEASRQVSQAATDLSELAAIAGSQPVAGKPLDQWFSELSGLAPSPPSPSTSNSGPLSAGAADELQQAARTLAGQSSESAATADAKSTGGAIVEREAQRFRTTQNLTGEDPLVARPVSTARETTSTPLASRTVGQGPLRTLVVAGLNGEDRAAVRAVEELPLQLEHQASVLRDQTLLLIPSANPGGIQAGRRFNEHNVDLNRNFPGRRYRPQAEFSGAFPASELETRQLLRLMFEFQPERVIHVVEDPLTTHVLFNRAGTELAGQLQRQQQVAIERLDFERLPGSLEEFADGIFHVPVFVICLKPDESAGLLAALIATVEAGAAPPQEVPRDSLPADPEPASPAGPVAGPRSTTPTAPVSGRGYEELPPPPQ